MGAKIVFTDALLRSLKPPSRYVYDAALPGFGVYVGINRKTFVIVRNGRRTKIGAYPFISLSEARSKARTLLYFQDIIPSVALKEAAAIFVKTHPMSPRWRKEQERLLNKHLLHHHTSFNTVTPQSISLLLDQLTKRPSEKHHAHTAISTFLNWCAERHYISANPILGLRLSKKPRARERTLTEEEIVILWNALTDPFPFVAIVKLLITTGQRLSEISNLQSSYIDPKRRLITLPMTKNGTSHTFPCTTLSLSILPSNEGRLFPSYNPANNMATLRKHLTIPHFTLHDLRRTFATIHAKIGTPVDVIEMLLNHKTGSRSPVQRIYDRYDRIEPMTQAMTAYEAYLTHLLSLST